MKIVFVSEWDPLTGGAFTVANNLINKMLKLKYSLDIHVVSFGNENKLVHKDGYKIHFIKNLDFPTARYWYRPNLLKNKIVEINPDLIHLNHTYPPYSFITQLPIPCIITVHGLTSLRVKRVYTKNSRLLLKTFFKFKMFEPYFEKKALQSATSIIPVSLWMKSQIDDIIGLDSKTVFIPNGIDYEKYCANESSDNLIHPSILFVGRLIEIKGVDILIKALSIVKTSYPKIHLYVGGDGNQCKNLRLLTSELDLINNITFLNFMPENEVIQMLSSADIFVLPSRFENAPMALMEALASGVPVIASNVGGIPHILDNGRIGILFQSENPEDLAQKIIKLLNDPKFGERLSGIGKEMLKEYSWDMIVEKTVDLYELSVSDYTPQARK